MAYHIYKTKGFVFRSAVSGEANRYFHIFTRELGLISALAQSVRKTTSKLRFGLNEQALSHFSLVRGKEFWRVIDARLELQPYSACAKSLHKQEVFTRLLTLTNRMIAQEERHPELFDILAGALTFLAQCKEQEVTLGHVEDIVSLRILKELGYVPVKPLWGKFLNSPFLSESLVSDFSSFETEARQSIIEALEVSHL